MQSSWEDNSQDNQISMKLYEGLNTWDYRAQFLKAI